MWVLDVDGTPIGSIRSEVLRPDAGAVDAVARAFGKAAT
jgi:hypothetical protein